MKKSYLIFFLFISVLVNAEIKLPAYFSNHMVLQQNEDILIFGKAATNEKITGFFSPSDYWGHIEVFWPFP